MKDIKTIISPLLLVLAAMIWGFAFSAQKMLFEVPPLLLGTLRSLFAAIFLFFVIILKDEFTKSERRLFLKKPFTKHELVGGILAGISLAAANLFQQLGLNSGTEAGKASFITGLYVVFVPIYALIIGKKPKPNALISVIIAVFGFYFLCITESVTLEFSDLLVFISPLIFPIYILTLDKYSKGSDAIRMSFIQFISSGLISFIPSLLFEMPTPISVIFDNIHYILILGVGSSGIAYTLQIIGQRGVSPTKSSVILSLESVFGVIGAMIFLGEIMTPREYLGAALLFIAVIISEIDIPFIKPRAN